MATQQHYPNSAEERLVWYGITASYPLFLIGALYISGSLLGWIIIAMATLRWYVQGSESKAMISALVWMWIASGLVMLLALIVGHIDWALGFGQTIKSTIGWVKGWALIPLFLVIGSVINIKPEMLIRAICILAFHSFIFASITLLVSFVGAPGDLFISPLKFVGGPGDGFFTVSLYGLNPESGGLRWRFFAPWAPAAGFISCLFLIFCLQEKNRFWRNWGVIGCVAMCLFSQSRAGWAIFIILFPALLLAHKFKNPWWFIALGVVIPMVVILGQPLFESLMNAYEDVKASRPGSTRVRATLAKLAIERWQAEAPIWGHGIVEPGPKIVEGMPIGSHHSWYGLLYVKGIVGFLALAVPLFFTTVYLLLQSHNNSLCRSAFFMLLVIFCYSFFENLEILSYLYWPVLIWIGMALNPKKSAAFHALKR
ncbi:O-antigen ligase family protein [Paraglaciecola sp. 25GB23A]|uniref:O-antigen ligase family protein n=1 Tax=Paraglaciecola sp. 25GB23A TaxID=3156068 RepID=UPI0032AF398D